MKKKTGCLERYEKGIRYGMLAALFAAAFFLPAYGGRLQLRRSAEAAKSQQIQTEAGGKANELQQAASGANGTIVLDAGHGGSDPGMTGAGGVTERELNLVYAKKLQVLLEAAGYRVVQTRTTKEGLYDAGETHRKAQDMQRRCALIEQEQPLLAVSIHQNSYPQDASVCGPQVFYYEHSEQGKQLAAQIQACMNDQLKVERPRVEKGNASYYILKRSAATTVIVECGFLTNPQEEAELQEEAYQNRLVQAVCDGILSYLKNPA